MSICQMKKLRFGEIKCALESVKLILKSSSLDVKFSLFNTVTA